MAADVAQFLEKKVKLQSRSFPRRRTRVRPWRRYLGTVALAACGLVGACRETDGILVADIDFAGNQAFTDGELSTLLITRDPGVLPWARRDPFDRRLFEADLKRLEAFYADRGYPEARVTGTDIEFNRAGTEVRVRIHLDEGEPVRVERVDLSGLEALPPSLSAAARRLPISTGDPMDREKIVASRDYVAFLLRDRGYPDAKVTSRVEAGSTTRLAVLVVEAEAGRPASFGKIEVVGAESVSPEVVLRALTFKSGDLYRESELLESQRRLFGLGLFDFAHVARTQAAPEPAGSDTGPPVTVTLKEGRPTRLQVGVGYGTEDGPRGSMEWRHLNLFGGARQFTATVKYSARLRGLSIDLAQPYVGHHGASVGADAGAWWRDEPSFTARSIGVHGRVTLQLGAERGPTSPPLDRSLRLGYTNEILDYAVTPDALDEPGAVSQLVALGIDPSTGRGSGRLALVGVNVDQSAFDRPLDPRRGYGMSVYAARAATWLGGTFAYTELQMEGRAHLPIGRAVVWSNRARVGALLTNASDAVPFSARYFLGGSASLRGWGRFEVSPTTTEGIPIGGRGLVELSSELRVSLGGPLGLVAFWDAGNAWIKPSDIRLNDLRANAGAGLRWSTAVGSIRADFGYQLTPIEGLLLDGQPERRRWRIHFGLGHAF